MFSLHFSRDKSLHKCVFAIFVHPHRYNRCLLLASATSRTTKNGFLKSPTPFTESQNCRGWKGPPEIIGSNPPAKAGSPEQAAQVGVQTGLEYLQRRRPHNLPGQPVPALRHPHREEVLSHVGAELPVLYLVATAPCPVPTND